MFARFTTPDTRIPAHAGIDPQQVAKARIALGCQLIKGYPTAITAPLTVGRLVSNFVLSFFRSFVLSFFRSFVLSLFRSFVLSFRYSTMSFPEQLSKAAMA